jgi:predicted DNA-binding transcriptional regulator AlpA
MATMKSSTTKKKENSAARRSIRAEIDDYADDVFLTEPEAAEACGVSPYTLKCWRLAREGKGPPAIKVYDMVRYRAADVRAWLTAMAV